MNKKWIKCNECNGKGSRLPTEKEKMDVSSGDMFVLSPECPVCKGARGRFEAPINSGDRSIKNENGVPIWVRANCKCEACDALRKLEATRKEP